MIINEGRPGKKLPTLTNPGVAGDLLSGKQLIGQDGNIITGTIPSKASTDISVSGRTVTVPAGYYPSQAKKSIASATQATPSITVSSGGLITASATQSAGYVASGTKSATKQLTTQAGKTVTPGTSQQTAVASGRYTTGTVYVAGDADLKAANIKSGVSIFGVAGSYSGVNPLANEFDYGNNNAYDEDHRTELYRSSNEYWADVHFGTTIANAIKNARYAIIACEITLTSSNYSSAHSLGTCSFVLILERGAITYYSGLACYSNTRRNFGMEEDAGFLRDIEFNPSADGTWSFMFIDGDDNMAERPDFTDSRCFITGYYSD